jgi:CheY-like chemotaxis protein
MLLNQKRIFVVEDNVQNKTIIQLLLEMQGAKVGIDRFGTDTINRLLNFMPVDAILLDLMLPNNVTGYEVFKRIRAVDKLQNIPIIAVSAAEPGEAIPKAKNLGFAGFISKPIEFENFAIHIAQIIRGEAIWQSGTGATHGQERK